MIRRDLPGDGRSAPRYLLIPQIEHAQLAGSLAQHWGGGQFAPLEPQDELLWAIVHHDDGWRRWDESPGIDPQRGVPRSFTEMEIDDALAIWSTSIDGAAIAGPLRGYLVGGHFCALARRSATWRKDDPSQPRAQTFVDDYEARMQSWLATWQSVDPAGNTAATAKRALAQLQFFDLLSLWFCCAEASGPDSVATPAGPELTLTPESPQRLRLSPWPFVVGRVNLEVAGRIVPEGPYASRAELAAAPAEPVILRWELQPGP